MATAMSAELLDNSQHSTRLIPEILSHSCRTVWVIKSRGECIYDGVKTRLAKNFEETFGNLGWPDVRVRTALDMDLNFCIIPAAL
jgi:hypothetical protein